MSSATIWTVFRWNTLLDPEAKGIYVFPATRDPNEALRVLELLLDPKLQWKVHKKAIVDKMATQTNALTRLTGSTWGLPLL
jgi:hypothetical protein